MLERRHPDRWGKRKQHEIGGGILHAMMSGKIAAGVLAAAVKKGDFSREFFNEYRAQFDKILGPRYDALDLFSKEIFTEPKDLKDFVSYKNQRLKDIKCSGAEAFKMFMKDERNFKGTFGKVYGK